MRVLFLSVLVVACAQAEATGAPIFPDWVEECRNSPEPSAVEAPASDWCKTHRCEVAGLRHYRPDADISLFTCNVMQRWSAATGLSLQFNKVGIRVSFVDELWASELSDPEIFTMPLSPICGRTIMSYGPEGETEISAIEINRNTPDGCQEYRQVLLHEIGHSLAGNIDHTKRGVMSASSTSSGLDDESMAFVCDHEPCSAFNPERYLRVQQ